MEKKSPTESYKIIVVIASFFCHVLQYGIVWTVGVYHIIFLEAFESSNAITAVIASLNTASYYFAGPLSSFLTNRYGERFVTVIGGLIGSLGIILSAFASNIYHLYVTFGFITGFGLGIAYIPAITSVTKTFTSGRTIAVGVAVSGLSIGTLAFPLIIRALVHLYGWRGSLILCGAICTNICTCGMLMSRVPRYCEPKVTPVHVVSTGSPSDTVNKGSHPLRELFTNYQFMFFSYTNLTVLLGLSVIYVHLPAFATLDLGLSKDEGAILFSIIGITNFVGRILFGLVVHVISDSESLLYGLALTVAAVLSMLLCMMKTFVVLATYASLFGFLTACIGTLTAPILLRVLTNHNLLSTSMAVILIFDAVGTIIGSIVPGYMYDITASYNVSFIFGGASMLVGCLPQLILGTRTRFCYSKDEIKVFA